MRALSTASLTMSAPGAVPGRDRARFGKTTAKTTTAKTV